MFEIVTSVCFTRMNPDDFIDVDEKGMANKESLTFVLSIINVNAESEYHISSLK